MPPNSSPEYWVSPSGCGLVTCTMFILEVNPAFLQQTSFHLVPPVSLIFKPSLSTQDRWWTSQGRGVNNRNWCKANGQGRSYSLTARWQPCLLPPHLPNRQPKDPRPIHPLGGKRWQREWEARFSAMVYSYLTLKETWKHPKLCRAASREL